MENSRGFNSAANNGGQSSRGRLSEKQIRALKLSKHVSNIIKDGAWERAYEELRKSGFLTSNEPFILSQAARVCLQLRKLNDAEEYLKRGLDTDPVNRFFLQLMGDVLVKKGDPAAAETFYARAIVSQEKDSRGRPEIPMGKMIQILRLQGRNEDALRVTEDLNRLYPRDIPGWRLKCEILRDLGRLDEALKAVEQLTQRYPHDSSFAALKRDIARQAGNSGQGPFSPADGPA